MAELPKNSTNIFATDPELRTCFQLIHAKKFADAQTKLEQKLDAAKSKKDVESEGLILSILGMLFRIKKDAKAAYKYYQSAEKCLPHDLSLKMISARLLIEEFRQFDTAERKLKKVIELAPGDFLMQHHAIALLAQCYFLMGRKAQAKKLFEQMLNQDFLQFATSMNLDFKTCEFFLRKKFEVTLCLAYLGKALTLAETLEEKAMVQFFKKLLDLFRTGLK